MLGSPPSGSGGPPIDERHDRERERVSLDDEWDDAFGWTYGRKLWNVGCG